MKRFIVLVSLVMLFGCGQDAPVTPVDPPKPSDYVSPFGIFNDYVYDGSGFDMSLAREAGNRWSRITLSWHMIEPRKDELDFSIADEMFEAHRQAGISPVVTLLSRSGWATGSKEVSALPDDWEEYEDFVYTVVDRYKDSVKYWQVENEVGDAPEIPSGFWAGSKEDYCELLQHAHSAIKEADPDAKVVLQGFANQMFVRIDEVEEFFEYFFNECDDYFDVVDFHQYYEPEDAIASIDKIREMTDKEVISTEAGDLDLRLFTRKGDVAVIDELLAVDGVRSEMQRLIAGGLEEHEWKEFSVFLRDDPGTRPILERYQAANLIKRYCITLSRGVSQLHWLGIRETPEDKAPDWFWPMMPLTSSDARKKPSFYTYSLMVDKLEGRQIEEISQAPHVYSAESDDTMYVIWCEDSETLDMTRFGLDGDILVTHIVTEQGQTDPEVETVDAGSVPCASPVFVEGP